MIDIREIDVESETARALVEALDADLRLRYPGEPIYGIEPARFRSARGVFLAAFDATAAVACGAFEPLDSTTVEIKRVFVQPSHRRRGLSRAVLAHLEQSAAARGFRRAILETASRQPEAIALYRTAGFTDVAPFGRYMSDPRSVYLGKQLGIMKP